MDMRDESSGTFIVELSGDGCGIEIEIEVQTLIRIDNADAQPDRYLQCNARLDGPPVWAVNRFIIGVRELESFHSELARIIAASEGTVHIMSLEGETALSIVMARTGSAEVRGNMELRTSLTANISFSFSTDQTRLRKAAGDIGNLLTSLPADEWPE